MVLDPQVVYSPIRLIGDLESTSYPYDRRRDTIGTAFILHVPSETIQGVEYGYLVTAAHVLDGQTSVDMQPAKIDGALYEPIRISDWRVPNTNLDVAVSPITVAPPDGGQYWSNPLILSVPLGNITPAPGDAVFYVGILTELDRPMVRSGTFGAVDQYGIAHDGGYDYPCHLVDCRSYGGFSGSPCFLYQGYPILQQAGWPYPPPMPPPNYPIGGMTHVILFAGMFTAHLTDKPGTSAVTSRYGVGVILRAQEIREVLMSDNLRQERQEQDEEVVKSLGDGPRLENVAHGTPNSSIAKTADLFRKVAEVDPADAAQVHRDHQS